MVKLSRSVTDVTLFLMADPTRQRSHHLNILHNHRKQNEKVFLCDKQIHAAVSTCELRAGGLLSQPLMIAGEPKVTRLRHTELPLATGSGLRSTEGEEGVKEQEDGEDAGKSAAGRSTFLPFYLCFLDVGSAGDRSKPLNNGRNHHAVYSVGPMFAVLRGVLVLVVPAATP